MTEKIKKKIRKGKRGNKENHFQKVSVQSKDTGVPVKVYI